MSTLFLLDQMCILARLQQEVKGIVNKNVRQKEVSQVTLMNVGSCWLQMGMNGKDIVR